MMCQFISDARLPGDEHILPGGRIVHDERRIYETQ